ELLSIIRERVYPERQRNNREAKRRLWWLFAERQPALKSALTSLRRCLVCSVVSKHLAFAFQPTGRVFSTNLFVFPFSTSSAFALLQSRVHEMWARLHSSTLEERLKYTASRCFETFPFPNPDPHTVIPSLEIIGERLYDTRARYMVDTQQGLTQTYNLLKDP